jgi:hypothetical protein
VFEAKRNYIFGSCYTLSIVTLVIYEYVPTELDVDSKGVSSYFHASMTSDFQYMTSWIGRSAQHMRSGS